MCTGECFSVFWKPRGGKKKSVFFVFLFFSPSLAVHPFKPAAFRLCLCDWPNACSRSINESVPFCSIISHSISASNHRRARTSRVSPTIGIWSNIGDWCVSPLSSSTLRIGVIRHDSGVKTKTGPVMHPWWLFTVVPPPPPGVPVKLVLLHLLEGRLA